MYLFILQLYLEAISTKFADSCALQRCDHSLAPPHPPLQNATQSCSSASLLQNAPACIRGEAPNDEVPKGTSQGAPTQALPPGDVGGDKPQDVLFLQLFYFFFFFGREQQPATLLTAKPVKTDLNHAKTLSTHSSVYCSCHIDLGNQYS